MLLSEDAAQTLDDGPGTLPAVLLVNAGMVLLTPHLPLLAVAALLRLDVENRTRVLTVKAGNSIPERLVGWAFGGSRRLASLGFKSLLDVSCRVASVVNALSALNSYSVGDWSHKPMKVGVKDLSVGNLNAGSALCIEVAALTRNALGSVPEWLAVLAKSDFV